MNLAKLATFTVALFGATVQAASLDHDRVSICDRSLEISASLRPSALFEATAEALNKGHFSRIYPLFADRYEATLSDAARARPEVSLFLAQLRAASFDSRLFDVVPDDTRTREILFEGSAAPIELDCATLAPHQSDMAAVSLLTAWMRGQQMLPALAERARLAADQSRAHEALMANGLPMWPWELWLNGKQLGDSDWAPLFRTQWVLLRPTAGVQMGTRSRAEGKLDASLGVEPIGFVRYRDADYSSWWGASLLITSSTRDGIGLGALLRWNNYVLGVTRNQSATAGKGDATLVFVGFDLYPMANHQGQEFTAWKAQQKNRVNELLQRP